MRYINDIIIHCTDTPPAHDWGRAEIDACHKANGWRGIGYHYVVKRDGTVERGRAISQPGAHCYGHNAHSIGVVYVGGRDDNGNCADTRTDAQKEALKKLIWKLLLMYKCRVHGHHDYNSGKLCPCFNVQKEFSEMAKRAAES